MVKLLEFLIVIILLSLFPRTFSSWSNLSFAFYNFSPNIRDFNYMGDASVSSVIDITTNTKGKNSTGRVTYSKLFHLWDNLSRKLADFRTEFTFVINSFNSSYQSDGMVFFLAKKDFPVPEDKFGPGLGLLSQNQSYQTMNSTNHPFLAVEFDTSYNTGLDEIMHDHVGIDIGSLKSKVTTVWYNSVLNGSKNTAWISYNSSTMELNVTFTGFKRSIQFNQHLSHLVDLKLILPEWVEIGFSAATYGPLFETHALESWVFISNLEVNDADSPPSPPDPGNRIKLKLEIGLSVTFACILVIGGAGFVFLKKKKKKEEEEEEEGSKKEDVEHISFLEVEFEQSAGPKRFSYDALAQATDNFAEERKLGQGGFGGVYKGFLLDLRLYVAVKKISSESKQGIKEYASEVKIISRVRHKNLVQLIGWCHEKAELLLVYELMSNGSLDHHLFLSEKVLSWGLRYKIACGLASALLYLHEEWDQAVLHRDIKSSNVMLDSDFNAKLGDFGLAKLVDHGKGSATTVLAGTFGYMAPECFSTSKTSTESDVYSFGIVCLEIACGRKPFDPLREEGQIRLVNWVWSLYGERKLMQAIDPRLADHDDAQAECLMILGLWCAHPDYCLRPSMKQATAVLSFEAPLPRIPLKFPVATYTSLPVSPEVPDIIGSSSAQASSNTGISSVMYTSSSSETHSSTTVLLSQAR